MQNVQLACPHRSHSKTLLAPPHLNQDTGFVYMHTKNPIRMRCGRPQLFVSCGSECPGSRRNVSALTRCSVATSSVCSSSPPLTVLSIKTSEVGFSKLLAGCVTRIIPQGLRSSEAAPCINAEWKLRTTLFFSLSVESACH